MRKPKTHFSVKENSFKVWGFIYVSTGRTAVTRNKKENHYVLVS